MIDRSTSQEIDKVVQRVLNDAGCYEPPIRIEDILEFLKVDRGFYDLQDPSLLQRFWHRVKIHGTKLKTIIDKVKLEALWLPSEKQILVDASLPRPKQEWASYHDAVHRSLKWHRQFFLGDTAQTLNPDFQEMLEAEANYGASALMFGGKLFTKEALDTRPSWESIVTLQKRNKKSCVTTLRRYVQFSHDIPMAMTVSTPWWLPIPADQVDQCRHYVCSERYLLEFGMIPADLLIEEINRNAIKMRGGLVAEFEMTMIDLNGSRNAFIVQSFCNQYYLLSLFVHKKRMN